MADCIYTVGPPQGPPSSRTGTVRHLRRFSLFSSMMPSLPPPPPTTAPATAHTPPPAPALLPWYFYTSPHPLDDPLSPLPPTTAPAANIKYPPRPFSHDDSHALEKAYQELLQERQVIVSTRPRTKSIQNRQTQTPTKFKRRSIDLLTSARIAKDKPIEYSEEGTVPAAVAIPTRSHHLGHDEKTSSFPDFQMYPKQQQESEPSPPKTPSSITSTQSSFNPAGTTSNPFIRAPSHRQRRRPTTPPPPPPPRPRSRSKAPDSPEPSTSKSNQPSKKIAVGVQRLHQVKLPSLTLEPIYWSPLHGLDNAGVIRGTWFYRDTMLPVETDKANALEKGWNEHLVWTDEWMWEVEVGIPFFFFFLGFFADCQ